MKLGFTTITVTAAGWVAILVAGSVLGYGFAQLARWPIASGMVIGVVALVVLLKLLDRRAWRRSLVVVKLDRSRNELHQLVEQLRSKGLQTAISDHPRGIACRGRNHRKVVAAITSEVGR